MFVTFIFLFSFYEIFKHQLQAFEDKVFKFKSFFGLYVVFVNRLNIIANEENLFYDFGKGK